MSIFRARRACVPRYSSKQILPMVLQRVRNKSVPAGALPSVKKYVYTFVGLLKILPEANRGLGSMISNSLEEECRPTAAATRPFFCLLVADLVHLGYVENSALGHIACSPTPWSYSLQSSRFSKRINSDMSLFETDNETDKAPFGASHLSVLLSRSCTTSLITWQTCASCQG